MKIPFEIISLKNETVSDVQEAYIELFKQHLIYKSHFTSETYKDHDDKMLGTIEDTKFFEVLAIKSHICGIDLSLTTENNWLLLVSVSGMHADLKVYFYNKKYKEAKALFDTIQNWLII